MRIHGDTLTHADILDAARSVGTVTLDSVSRHGSRSRAGAFDVYLFGTSSHRPNNRDHDADEYAATWDEWGIFLAALFKADATLTVPRVYRDSDDFHFRTGNRFDGHVIKRHRQHRFNYEGTPREQTCKCGAVTRWEV